MTERPPYDHRNCQSLFGYAASVHLRSRGICQLCGAGEPRFEWWRQLTVEHLIGESQGGYLHAIRGALAERFPQWSSEEVAILASRLDELNTVSACSFCNATTSRARAPASMSQLIRNAVDQVDLEVTVRHTCEVILEARRADVAWKLEAVRAAFEEQVRSRW